MLAPGIGYGSALRLRATPTRGLRVDASAVTASWSLRLPRILFATALRSSTSTGRRLATVDRRGSRHGHRVLSPCLRRRSVGIALGPPPTLSIDRLGATFLGLTSATEWLLTFKYRVVAI